MSLLLAVVIAAGSLADAPKERSIDPKGLRAELEKALAKYDVPALGVAVVTSKGLLAADVVGVRKKGSDVKVTIDDCFHIGSDTKAITATLIAILIEKKLLAWDLTLEKAFPELAGKMTTELREVTLEQLLRHQAGLRANMPKDRWLVLRKGTPRQLREEDVLIALTEPVEVKPGTKFLYSNLGYVTAACMAERATNSSWEELMKKYVFGPLKMTSGGFGAMATTGKIDQPYGHTEGGKAIDPGESKLKGDNPPVMGPAGRVHCSLGDWAKFVADQLAGAKGKYGLLPAAAYRKLHETVNADEKYTPGGWGVLRGPGKSILIHDGSNTMNYATAVLLPWLDLAVLAVCNQGDKKGQKATIDIRESVLLKLLK